MKHPSGLLIAIILLVGICSGPALAQEELLVPVQAKVNNPTDPNQLDILVRSRPVYINPAALSGAEKSIGESLILNLFPDVQLTLVLEEIVKRTEDSYTWIGRLAGDADSSITISVLGEITQANIHANELGEFQIRYIADGLHEVREIDPTGFPPCSVGPQHAVAPKPTNTPPRLAQKNAKTATYVVDVMVVYTPAASTAVGGTAAMEALINLAITESNDAYLFSQVDMELRLVHQQEVTYTETTFGTALNDLTTNGDSIMDEVHTLRETYGADMVSLLIHEPSSCGLAWLMTSLAGDFSGSAFSVEHHDCATGYYSFAHELGHNMGSHHDVANAGGQGLYPYSYGWRWNSDIYRSIMAYAPGTRVQRFSNPNVNYLGFPTGSAGVADNALSLNNAAATVAGWRDAVGQIVVAPGGSASFTGDAGGPFTPATFSYTLTNVSSTETAPWTASVDQAWVSLSATSGTIPASGNVVVDVSITSAANSFEGGTYPATITFTDVNESITFPRNVSLGVAGPPPNTQHWFSMATDPGWTTQAAWAFGAPTGGGSFNHDPLGGITGSNVYGYNLSGDYTNNMPEVSLTTTALDCSYLENVHLNFHRWLGVESATWDHAKIQVSSNGSSWTDVWVHTSTSAIEDTAWQQLDYDISAVANGQSTVYVRWVMGATDSTVTYPGWNIDDVAITGDIVYPVLTDLWVDFTYNAVELGTEEKPYKLLGTAVTALTGNYTIFMKGAVTPVSSPQTLRIIKPMRLEAVGGGVRIGG